MELAVNPSTLFEKIWRRHVVTQEEDVDLLYVDRCLMDEGCKHVFEKLVRERHAVRHPRRAFGFADHYVPSINRHLGISDPAIREMVETMARNAQVHGFNHYGMDDLQQGIVHVVTPELGAIQPGLVIGGGDSHTSTHGAFGAFAFGIGVSDTAHVLATQTIWYRRPKTMRVLVKGKLPVNVSSKDVILAIIRRIGIGGGIGHVIEYAGNVIDALSMDARMTICNMSIEAGAKAGLISPDDTTFEHLAGRPFTPKGAAWDQALEFWRTLPSDSGAVFDKEIILDADSLAPVVTWGTNPEHAVEITDRVPDPDAVQDLEKRSEYRAALDYMGLTPGTPMTEIKIDRVFIGSCTNSRIEDLRIAAEVVRGARAAVPAWIVPGSSAVKRQAESEGLDRLFRDAGFEWREPGCSLCTAINGDTLQPGERCASTSNRNFQGRQGTGGRTHLMSPAMAAAAALTGHLTDVRHRFSAKN